MLRSLVAALSAFCLVSMTNVTDARQHHRALGVQVAMLSNGDCIDRPWTCGPIETAITIPTPSHQRYMPALNNLAIELASKVAEITSACGSKLISDYRPGARVRGSGHPSLHSVYPARAADLKGNPSCIYAHLRSWQGGYSIDYGRVRHVHISYSPPGSGPLAGREWGRRFAHYGGGHHHHARRHAHTA